MIKFTIFLYSKLGEREFYGYNIVNMRWWNLFWLVEWYDRALGRKQSWGCATASHSWIEPKEEYNAGIKRLRFYIGSINYFKIVWRDPIPQRIFSRNENQWFQLFSTNGRYEANGHACPLMTTCYCFHSSSTNSNISRNCWRINVNRSIITIEQCASVKIRISCTRPCIWTIF